MKNNRYFLNTVLAVVVFVACAIALLVRVWLPAAVMPALNIPMEDLKLAIETLCAVCAE